MQLPDGFLANAPALKEFLLHKNQLSQLPANFLVGAPALEVLGLSKNQLMQLPKGFMSTNQELKVLVLQENPIFERLRETEFAGLEPHVQTAVRRGAGNVLRGLKERQVTPRSAS